MKKFSFRFQSVLEMKRDLEDRRQRELSELIRLRDSQMRILESMERHRDRCEEQIRTLCLSDGTVGLSVLCQVYLMMLSKEMDAQRQTVANASRDTNKKRKELTKAAKERRIMERLLERDRAGFAAAVEKAEQGLMDEMSLNKYARNASRPEE